MSCCSACGKHACACRCGAISGTPLPLYNRPGLTSLRYRVGTYADFRATMQRDLSDAALPALAGLRTREPDDAAMALLDTWAVGADVLTFYQERIANEGYLRTATERRSVLELARLVDYRLRPGVAASVYLAYTVDKDSPPVTLPAGARAQSVPAPGEQMQTFETAAPLEARYEWNALQPRLTRPQRITAGTLDSLTGLYFKGVANNLKSNDWLVFEFKVGSAPQARQILQVTIDPERQWTAVTLQSTPNAGVFSAAGPSANGHPATITKQANSAESGFASLVAALRQPPTVQPANTTRLSRSVASALGTASDVRPQLLLHFEPRIVDTFYPAWSNTPAPANTTQVRNIYVQRIAAARFGYNAPSPLLLSPPTPLSPPAPHLAAGIGSATESTTPGADRIIDTPPNPLYLDNAYDGIQPGSYVIVCTPPTEGGNVDVRKVHSAAIHPYTNYGISGKTTELRLEGDAAKAELSASNNLVRLQQVFAQSEKLEVVDMPIAGNVGAVAHGKGETPRDTGDSATRLTLDSAVDGLTSGRWVIVEGQRSDVPGTHAVHAAELVMIEAVEQNVDATLPGDTVHSTLVFANQGLAYRYVRDSVVVHANVVRATHGQTRHEVLGSGNAAMAMQAFVLKQSPLTYVSAATVSGVASTLAVRVNDMQWHETRSLAFVGATERNFVTTTDDTGKTTVQFGDGMHGARPPTGIENIIASYRNGIGAPGNVKARQISLLATKPLGVKEVINPLRASGGADAETRDQARCNVPLAVLALDRLVSVPDYADFARTFGGVGKAAAIKLGKLVQVTIAGVDDAPIDANSDLYRNLKQALQRYGDPALPVRLGVRELLALTITAKVGVQPDYTWEAVEPVVRATLLDAFGFERRALAQSAYLSELVACIQAVRGVAWVDVDAFDQTAQKRIIDGLSGDHGPAPWPSLRSRVPAWPARLDTDGKSLLPAQLACLPPNIPDTLLLEEATP